MKDDILQEDVSPRIVEAEFRNLMAKDPEGILRAEAIVKVAENPLHAFHEWFTWDDDEAARRWRLEQARFRIKSFKIFIEPLNITVRGLTSLESDRTNGGGFRWMTDVMARPDLRKEMLEIALRDLQSAESKFGHLEELAKVWAASNDVKKSLKKLVTRERHA